MAIEQTPVLIVGAGAAGLATSSLLAQHGIGSLLVERRREFFLYPKARNLTFRSFEIFRSMGLSDEIDKISQDTSSVIVKPALNSPVSNKAVDFSDVFGEFAALSPEPPGRYCPQSAFEPVLLAKARACGSDVRYGTELVSFEQDGSGVTALIRDLDSGETETVRAEYLVAADGVRSPVRDALGVAVDGHGALPLFAIFTYFRSPCRTLFPGLAEGNGVQILNDDVNAMIINVKDDFSMFMHTYFPESGETVDQCTPERCRELILKAAGEEMDVEIVEVAPWQPNERVAQQFQLGRVFLVGDSAHTMPPFKGGGANAAIQSAHNLAWKLAAVLRGQADPSLLATYHAERLPVGRFTARQSLSGPVVKLWKTDVEAFGLPEEEEKPLFALVIGHQYSSAAVVAELPAPGHDGVLLVEELRGQPGTRIPHVWVWRGGSRISTLDLVEGGFVVLTDALSAQSGAASWEAAAAAAADGLGFDVRVCRIGSDEVAEESAGAWRAATGLGVGGALLVRPDDFVGWRCEQLPVDPQGELRRALAAILGR